MDSHTGCDIMLFDQLNPGEDREYPPMARNEITPAAGPKFEWVRSGVDVNGSYVSFADRVAIRRQAMRAVSDGWRRRSDRVPVNRGQYPINYYNNSTSTATAKASTRPNSQSVASAPHDWDPTVFPRQMPPSPFERLTAKSGIDILNLSDLTAIHIEQAVSAFFHHNPGRLVTLLRQKQASYLAYIPSRYGQSPCLDNAVHTLVAKVRDVLDPCNLVRQTTTLSSYGRAIGSLQASINDSTRWKHPDVLCATVLLGLVEVACSSRTVNY